MTFDLTKQQTKPTSLELFHMQVSTGRIMEKRKMKSHLQCSDSLSSWINNAKNPNLFWYHYIEKDEPLHLDNPIVEIEIGYLKGRSDWSERNIFIESYAGHVTLFRGKLINGKLKGNIDPKFATHPAWRSRQGHSY